MPWESLKSVCGVPQWGHYVTHPTHTHIDLQLLCEGIAIYKTFYPHLIFSKWESPVQLVPGAQGALGVPEKPLSCPTVGPPLRNTSNTTHTHIDLQLLCWGIAIYKTFYPHLPFSKGGVTCSTGAWGSRCPGSP